MVLLTTTIQILEVLAALPPSTILELSPVIDTITGDTNADTNTSTDAGTTGKGAKRDSAAIPTTLDDPISHQTLIALARLRLKHGSEQHRSCIPPLNTLLRGTRPYIPAAPSKPAPTPEYMALMNRLRERRDAQEYIRLVKQKQRGGGGASGGFLSGSGDHDDLLDEDVSTAEDNISPSLVLNIALSIVMCAVAMFQMTKWWPNDGIRVLVSLAVGLVVGVAEVGVYSIYLMKVKRAKDKERRKKEIKTVIGEFVPPSDEGEARGQEIEGKIPDEGHDKNATKLSEQKDTIWGKGINGGVRRRVREKWEKEQGQQQQ